MLLACVGVIASSCGGDISETTYEPITVIADGSRTSPLPDLAAGAGASAVTFAPLDLSALGDNASSSELPSAIPSGVEVGFTEEGYPYRGSPDAPVKLIEYSDYACPFCARYTSVNVPDLLQKYAVSGDVQFIFREFPLVSIHPTAPTAHVAAYCLGEQSAQLYWDMHDILFERQGDWDRLADPADAVRSFAESLGADMGSFEECVASERGDEVVAKGIEDGGALGFNGTPSFQLTGEGVEGSFNIIGAQAVEVFANYFDQLLAGEAPTDPEPEPGEDPEPAGLPLWADIETGLKPDPDRPGINIAGDFYKGNPDASVVVVEFSDFQCPFCRDHARDIQPTLDAEFVDTGKIMWVYKHLPLNIHPLAPNAGAAAECAGDQGRFWEMYELLFEEVERWTEGSVDDELVALAGDIGLDTAAFETCYNSRGALERVLADLADARGIVSQTPSFVVIIGDRGTLMEGSRQLDQFIATLEARLEQAAEAAATDG